jgi:methyl-accepting chemotaxis protein
MGKPFANRLSIRSRLIVAMVGTSTLAAVFVSAFGYYTAQNSLTGAQYDKLTTIREHKAAQIESYLSGVIDQAENLAGSPEAVDAMVAFRRGWENLPAPSRGASDQMTRYYATNMVSRLPEDQAKEASAYLPDSPEGLRLQELYLAANPNPVGSKQLYTAAGDGSAYTAAHAQFHPFFLDYQERFGYYDIFLIDPDEGQVVYSVFKEADFATSLVKGPYSDSNFAAAFRGANQLAKGKSMLVDFAPYAASYGAPAAFIASPIFDGDTRIGVLAFQLPLNKIDAVMTNSRKWEQSGLGQSGEAFIVGPDQYIRTESRFFVEHKEQFLAELADTENASAVGDIERLGTVVGKLKVSSEGTEAALDGKTGSGLYTDYRGESVMASYRPLDIPGLQWVILSEIDEAEALAPVRDFRNQALLGALVVLLAAITVATIVGAHIARPVVAAAARLRSLASGERATDAMDENVGSELGQLASAYNDLVLGMADLSARAQRVARGETAGSEQEGQKRNISNNGILADSFLSMERTQQRLAGQAKLIAKGDLHNAALREVIPGELGAAFSEMAGNLRILARQAHAIAAGNLVDESLQTRIEGELGESFERMVRSLQGLVTDIQMNSLSLNATASKLHEAALGQQLGASEQASAVEETRRILTTLSSSAKEIAAATSAVYSNAEITQQTNNQTSTAIRELSGHTARIGEIVSFIKDIANKSDLLALNAALEGTKAGEAGRSFSLVATQMQRLAEQIMGSLKDIDALTEDIRRATSSTVSAVEQTSRLSTQTTVSAGSIAEAIQEQQVGTQQSTTAMDQISAVAQKSVMASSELVEASRKLQSLSDTFQRVVSHFSTEAPARTNVAQNRQPSRYAA